ncbi:MAG TPA: helix-turn-helix transcriptional regulator [Steroidobacteraceae bacterium]|jgi:AraC-like DNA-binding protein|nr:helix-turn-helix transcriptional regulator [Steroidobacteraceae bacterium]
MSAIQTSLYLVAVALCVFSTGLTTRRMAGRPLRFFTAFLVIQSCLFFCELWIAHTATPYKALALGVLMSGALLLAPCLWLAIREGVTGEVPRLREIPRVHGVAILIGVLCTLPLMSSAHGGSTFANPVHPASWLYSRSIHTTMLICMGIFIAQVPWYLRRCRALLLERLDGRPRHWAAWPLAIVFTTWALAIVRTLDCAFIKWPPAFSLVVALISVSVTVAALYLLLREFDPAPAPRPVTERYARSKLGEGVRRRIRRKLEATLARQAYKKSDLSLRELADMLNESPHYVSQIISQELASNFYDLVNRYRIEHAKKLLRDSPDSNVLMIAMDVGFNSKSAFHAAFRRATGTTPGQFRQSSP